MSTITKVMAKSIFASRLLDYRSPSEPHPDAAKLFDTHKEGWNGLHALFTRIANQAFQEGLTVYRAAWRRGLTTPEIDKLASASSVGERYDHGYWLKEKVFRLLRARLHEARQNEPAQAQKLEALEKDLARLYYLGQFDSYAKRIAEVPGK